MLLLKSKVRVAAIFGFGAIVLYVLSAVLRAASGGDPRRRDEEERGALSWCKDGRVSEGCPIWQTAKVAATVSMTDALAKGAFVGRGSVNHTVVMLRLHCNNTVAQVEYYINLMRFYAMALRNSARFVTVIDETKCPASDLKSFAKSFGLEVLAFTSWSVMRQYVRNDWVSRLPVNTVV